MKAHGKTKEAIEATGGDPESDDTGGATSEDRRFGSGKPRLVQPIFEARGQRRMGLFARLALRVRCHCSAQPGQEEGAGNYSVVSGGGVVARSRPEASKDSLRPSDAG